MLGGESPGCLCWAKLLRGAPSGKSHAKVGGDPPREGATAGNDDDDAPKRVTTSETLSTVSSEERREEMRSAAQAAAKTMLAEFSKQVAEGNCHAAAGHFASTGNYTSLHHKERVGPIQIERALARVQFDTSKPGDWSTNHHGFECAAQIVLPGGAKCEVVQFAFVDDTNHIAKMSVQPKQQALATVLAFATAWDKLNTEGALRLMTDNIVWKTWHGCEHKGKESVRKLLNQQTSHGEERKALTDFVFVSKSEGVALWRRLLQIGRDGGWQCQVEQTIRIVSQMTKMQPVHITNQVSRSVFSAVPRISHVELTTLDSGIKPKHSLRLQWANPN